MQRPALVSRCIPLPLYHSQDLLLCPTKLCTSSGARLIHHHPQTGHACKMSGHRQGGPNLELDAAASAGQQMHPPAAVPLSGPLALPHQALHQLWATPDTPPPSNRPCMQDQWAPARGSQPGIRCSGQRWSADASPGCCTTLRASCSAPPSPAPTLGYT